MTLGLLLAFFAMLSSGLSAFFGKIAARHYSGQVMTFLGQLVSGILIIPLFLLIPPHFQFSPLSFVIILTLGLLNAVVYSSYCHVLSREKVSLVSTLISIHSLLVCVIGFLFLGEVVSWSKLIALPILFGGLALLLLKPKDFKGRIMDLRSLLDCFISIVGWGLYFPLLKVSGDYMDAITPIVLCKILTGIFMFVILQPKEREQIRNIARSSGRWSLIAMTLCNAVILVFYNLAAREVGVSVASPILAGFPVITSLLAMVFLKEKVSLGSWMGIVGVVVSVILLKLNF